MGAIAVLNFLMPGKQLVRSFLNRCFVNQVLFFLCCQVIGVAHSSSLFLFFPSILIWFVYLLVASGIQMMYVI